MCTERGMSCALFCNVVLGLGTMSSACLASCDFLSISDHGLCRRGRRMVGVGEPEGGVAGLLSGVEFVGI